MSAIRRIRKVAANDVTAIGLRVREARRLARMSQVELARAVGYSGANMISKLETGLLSVIDIVLLQKIASATGMPLLYLTTGMMAAEGDAAPWATLIQCQVRQIELLEQVVKRLERLERAGSLPPHNSARRQ